MPRKFYFLGDSHLWPAMWAAEAGLFAPHECQFESVGGATAVGLRHPTSQTQALLRYRECLMPYDPAVVPVFQLGEVDCGFVIWLRAQRYGESVAQQLDESLQAYRRFLVEMREAGYADMIVTSATPPTIRDGDLEGDVKHLRREVQASYVERSALTARYNASLADICRHERLTFVDFTADFVDPESGLLNETYRAEDLSDHHLHRERAGRVWAAQILAQRAAPGA